MIEDAPLPGERSVIPHKQQPVPKPGFCTRRVTALAHAGTYGRPVRTDVGIVARIIRRTRRHVGMLAPSCVSDEQTLRIAMLADYTQSIMMKAELSHVGPLVERPKIRFPQRLTRQIKLAVDGQARVTGGGR